MTDENTTREGGLVALRREARIADVVRLLVSGEAKSIRDACRQLEISRRTLYDWISKGALDTSLAEVTANATTEAVSLLMTALPDVVQRIIDDALDREGKLSARDRDSARRTYLLAVQKLGHLLPDVPIGEDADAWLAKYKSFSPMQINISINEQPETRNHPVVEIEGEVVDGEAKEVES